MPRLRVCLRPSAQRSQYELEDIAQGSATQVTPSLCGSFTAGVEVFAETISGSGVKTIGSPAASNRELFDFVKYGRALSFAERGQVYAQLQTVMEAHGVDLTSRIEFTSGDSKFGQ